MEIVGYNVEWHQSRKPFFLVEDSNGTENNSIMVVLRFIQLYINHAMISTALTRPSRTTLKPSLKTEQISWTAVIP